MARVEKNAAGEDVRVDTAAFGCIVIEAAAPTPAPDPAPKAKPATRGAATALEGVN